MDRAQGVDTYAKGCELVVKWGLAGGVLKAFELGSPKALHSAITLTIAGYVSIEGMRLLTSFFTRVAVKRFEVQNSKRDAKADSVKRE